MNKKAMKPIPTTVIIGIILLGCSGLLFKYDQFVSAVLMIILVSVIFMIDIILIPSSHFFLRGKGSKKNNNNYKNFARFYLSDRRLSYSKKTFQKAIDNKWLDIITMCILLGIKSKLEKEERKTLLLDALHKEDKTIYEVLLNGGFSGDFIVTDTGEHFLFETLKVKESLYLEYLLDKKIDPNRVDQQGVMPIFIAIKENLIEHVRVLIKHGVNLKVVNNEGLTPLLYALAEEKIEICEILINELEDKKVKEPIAFHKLNGTLSLATEEQNQPEQDLLVKLIASKDQQILEALKCYLKDKKESSLKVESGVEVYSRLSTVHATMEKQKVVADEAQIMYKEEECKQDLYNYIIKNYKFCMPEDFKVESIYKTPKCIDSDKESCQECHGTGLIECSDCSGSGKMSCPDCEGEGNKICSKCQGTQIVSCYVTQQFLECKNCKDGSYECVKCNKEGMGPCPECEGHGTVKCYCPSDKKRKCPHCDKGYTKVGSGMYKKCSYCHEGEICLLCNNTGWVLERFKGNGYLCKTCKGTKKAVCTVCKGTKKVKCARKHEAPCACNQGYEICETCTGEKEVDCKTCEGMKNVKCPKCDGGHVYTNTNVDFKAYNTLVSEDIIGKREGHSLLRDLTPTISEKVCSGHPYIKEVFTMQKINLLPSDIKVSDRRIESAIKEMVKDKKDTGIIDIVEFVPLDYILITIKPKKGKETKCILVNNHFYKTL